MKEENTTSVRDWCIITGPRRNVTDYNGRSRLERGTENESGYRPEHRTNPSPPPGYRNTASQEEIRGQVEPTPMQQSPGTGLRPPPRITAEQVQGPT